MTLLGEVGGFPYDIVAPLVDFGDKENVCTVSSPVVAGARRGHVYGHAVAHCHGAGGADAAQAEIAFHLAFHLLPVVGADNITVAGIPDDYAVHITIDDWLAPLQGWLRPMVAGRPCRTVLTPS